tara:strand:+ start:2040 stop:2252 length:213 start_codon:yes stop_codon:yes gene_type:complete
MLKPSWRSNPEAYKKWREETLKTRKNNTTQNNTTQNNTDSLYTGSTDIRKPSWRSEPEAYEKWRLAKKSN